jgi:hypothetical protein
MRIIAIYLTLIGFNGRTWQRQLGFAYDRLTPLNELYSAMFDDKRLKVIVHFLRDLQLWRGRLSVEIMGGSLVSEFEFFRSCRLFSVRGKIQLIILVTIA